MTVTAFTFFYAGGDSEEYVVSTGDDAWTFFDVTAHLRAGDSLVGFSMWGNTTGVTRLDDISITSAVPEPATLGIAFTVLGALALLRRRKV